MHDRYAVQIRSARADDLTAILDVNQRANVRFEGAGLIAAPRGAPEQIPVKYFEEALFGRLLLVAAMHNQPVGFALCKVERPDLYLEQLSVTPEYGRRGIGGALVEAVCAEAAERRLAGVTLTTFKDVAWNAPFYAKHGFSPVPRRGLALWQIDIEAIQSETMDVSRRCFMRRAVAGRSHAAQAA